MIKQESGKIKISFVKWEKKKLKHVTWQTKRGEKKTGMSDKKNLGKCRYTERNMYMEISINQQSEKDIDKHLLTAVYRGDKN